MYWIYVAGGSGPERNNTVKIQSPHLNLTSREHYLDEVCQHVGKVLLPLEPASGTGHQATHVGDSESLIECPFSLHLALVIDYLSGSTELAADEAPDLLQQVHEVVHGVSGCQDLEIAICAAHAERVLHPTHEGSAPTPSN